MALLPIPYSHISPLVVSFTINVAQEMIPLDLQLKESPNKNAFQWDAYRPLVDRIPACTAQKGVSTQGVSAQGGVYPGGGVCPGRGNSMQWGRDPPVDRQTPVKT